MPAAACARGALAPSRRRVAFSVGLMFAVGHGAVASRCALLELGARHFGDVEGRGIADVEDGASMTLEHPRR